MIVTKAKTINKIDAHQPDRDFIMMEILKSFVDSISLEELMARQA